MTEYEFVSKSFPRFKIAIEDGVFVPTHTSALCVEAAAKVITDHASVLDLGCGSGVVAIALSKKIKLKSPLFASDISNTAVKIARHNMNLHSLLADVRHGSLFKPWLGLRVDYIVDDVSGIAEEIAALSPWFSENIPCTSGVDGTELTQQVIREAPNHLNENGGIIFPVISLSRQQKIIKAAAETFKYTKKIETQKWFLPDEMKNLLPLMRSMKERGLIHFEERFGAILCETSIYYCSNFTAGSS